ncbi:hypothetical protein WA026_015179, partial [Henosepilachna vigintioctopunctata]
LHTDIAMIPWDFTRSGISSIPSSFLFLAIFCSVVEIISKNWPICSVLCKNVVNKNVASLPENVYDLLWANNVHTALEDPASVHSWNDILVSPCPCRIHFRSSVVIPHGWSLSVSPYEVFLIAIFWNYP